MPTLWGSRDRHAACMSGDDRARLEDINASHCATSSLYQYRGQNACQLHHSHSATQVGDTPRTVMMCGRASHGICEQSMLGHGRELTIFWGTDVARGGRLVWKRDVRGLDPDGCLVRRPHGRHHRQENRDAAAATSREWGILRRPQRENCQRLWKGEVWTL